MHSLHSHLTDHQLQFQCSLSSQFYVGSAAMGVHVVCTIMSSICNDVIIIKLQGGSVKHPSRAAVSL